MPTLYCSQCGEPISGAASFCEKCGTPLPATARPVAIAFVEPYGGFWIRVVAYLMDRFIVGIAFTPIWIFFGLRLAGELNGTAPNGPDQFGPIFHFVGIVAPLAFIVQWLYEAFLTSSSWQATVGKRVLNLKVTDEAGNRISFERATGRFFAKILSGLCFWIGYLMIAFTARKRGLHDMLAGTLVMKT